MLIMRMMDVFYAFPSVLLAVAISGTMGGGIANGLLALTLVFIPPLCRVIGSGDDANPQPRFRRGGARERRLRPVDHLLSHAAQHPGAGVHLRFEPDLGLDPAGVGPVVSRPGRRAADRGLGLDALDAPAIDLCPAAGLRAAGRRRSSSPRSPSTWSATGCAKPWTSKHEGRDAQPSHSALGGRGRVSCRRAIRATAAARRSRC